MNRKIRVGARLIAPLLCDVAGPLSLSAQQVVFFAAHEAIGSNVGKIAAFLQAQIFSIEEQTRIDRLCHFCNTPS